MARDTSSIDRKLMGSPAVQDGDCNAATDHNIADHKKLGKNSDPDADRTPGVTPYERVKRSHENSGQDT